MKTFELNGETFHFDENTVFLIEVGKGDKGAYRPLYTIIGNIAQAHIHYRGINVGNGYKKRLRAPSIRKAPLLRQFS
jgi:hypothetical protein